MKTWDEVTERRRADPGYAGRIARRRAEALQEIREYQLAELRALADYTQQELAYRMGSDQPRVSRVEAGVDMKLSTLRSYVEALGGELHLCVELPGREPLTLSI